MEKSALRRMNQSPEFYELSIDNLQLNNRVVALLKKRGLSKIGTLFAEVSGNWPALKRSLGPAATDLTGAFSDLQSVTDGSSVDWIKYWKLRQLVFYFPYASCDQFKALPENVRRMPLDSSFGPGINALSKRGILTVGCLIDGLAIGIGGLKGVGPSKLQQIIGQLIQLYDAWIAGELAIAETLPPEQIENGDIFSLPVEALNLGVKERWLKKHGIVTLSDLKPFLYRRKTSIPNVGHSTLRRARARIELLTSQSSEGTQLDWAGYAASLGEEPNVFLLQQIQQHQDNNKEISERIRNLPIEILYLGVKEKHLLEADVRIIDDLLKRIPLRRGEIPRVGPSTENLAQKRVSLLLAAECEQGDIDFQCYFNEIGVTIIPSFEISSAREFLSSLRDVFREIEAALRDDLLRAIFANRLCCGDDEKMTLEEIAQAYGGGITRERVRQREAKLLSSLADGLLRGFSSEPAIFFKEDYCLYWAKAAQQLESIDEISLPDLVSAVAGAWESELGEVEAVLPLILPIISGEITSLKVNFKERLELVNLGSLSNAARHIPLSRLCWGLVGRKLIDLGYKSLGDIVDGLRDGYLEADGAVTPHFISKLSAVSESIDGNGELNWGGYAEKLGVPLLPECERGTQFDVFENLILDLDKIISLGTTWKNASEIFRLRTSQVATVRPTLQTLAEQLKTHQPSVKRIETDILGFLNDALVGLSDSQKRVLIRPSYLQHWSEFAELYAANPNFTDFQSKLLKSTYCDQEVAVRVSSTVWAVLNGYPYGRKSKALDRAHYSHQTPLNNKRIVLRGFRRAH